MHTKPNGFGRFGIGLVGLVKGLTPHRALYIIYNVSCVRILVNQVTKTSYQMPKGVKKGLKLQTCLDYISTLCEMDFLKTLKQTQTFTQIYHSKIRVKFPPHIAGNLFHMLYMCMKFPLYLQHTVIQNSIWTLHYI